MTKEDLKTEQEVVTEILNIFYEFGLNDLWSFTNKVVDTHKLTPHQYYFMMVSLLEAFMKYFSVTCDRTSLKEIFDSEDRQGIVDCFSKALSKGSTKFEHI